MWTWRRRRAAPLISRFCSEGPVYVVYTYQPRQRLGALHGLATGEPYSAWWFDPRTGTRFAIADDIAADTEGKWLLPSPPSHDDWVLLLRRGRASAEDMATPSLSELSTIYNTDWPVVVFPSASATDLDNGYHPDETPYQLTEHACLSPGKAAKISLRSQESRCDSASHFGVGHSTHSG